MSRPDRLLTIIMLAAVGASIYAAALRWRAEMPNRTVAVIVDWQEVEALVAAAGVTTPRALARLRAAGATDVALAEQHLSELVADGEVTVLPPDAAGLEDAVGRGFQPAPQGTAGHGRPALQEDAPPEGVVLSAYDAPTADRVRAYLAAKLPPGSSPLPAGGGRAGLSPLLIPCRASPAYLETVGLGWPVERPSIAADAGLAVVARMDNYPGARPEAITFMAAQAAFDGADLVIFSGDQVLGYPGLVDETAQVLQAAGLDYGSVELAGQLGDYGLGRALDGAVVRVHSIAEGEMITLSPAVAVARYVRAVRERDIRACYVRLFLAPRERVMEFNERYLGALARGLRSAGYSPGSPRPFPPVGVPPWAVMLMAAGAVAAAVFALGRVVTLPEWLAYLLLVLGVALGAALLMVAPHMLRAEKALLAAIAFPAIGLIAVARGARTADGAPTAVGAPTVRAAPHVPAGALAARAGGWLIGASALSLAGGLVAAGLLSERLYMSNVLQFTGVKLALAAPLLAVGLVWTLGFYSGGGWPAYRSRVQENFRRVWNRPVYVWEAVLAAALVAAAAVMLMRSGNQPAVEVSGLELRARDILEQVLLARPRTKEFLVGHPALMLAVAMALRGRTRWVLLLLLLGAMGQASLVNTFCHLHTPLLISLVRTANGLWLGLAIGSIAVWVWDRLRGAAAEMPEQQTTGS